VGYLTGEEAMLEELLIANTECPASNPNPKPSIIYCREFSHPPYNKVFKWN